MHANQATSFVGGAASVIGGTMAQASPDASVSNTGIVIGATGLIACLLNGLYPWFKTWLESRRVVSDIEALKRDVADGVRKLAEEAALHRSEMESIRQKRHDERDKFNAMYLRQQGDLSEALIKIARLEGTYARAINTNADSIKAVADAHDPPIRVATPHIEPLPPFPADDDEPTGVPP